MDDLTREFLLESQEGLDRMERCLTDLETRPGDTELLAEIFRAYQPRLLRYLRAQEPGRPAAPPVTEVAAGHLAEGHFAQEIQDGSMVEPPLAGREPTLEPAPPGSGAS